VRPEPAVPSQPRVDLAERSRLDRVQASGTVWSNGCETGVAQDPKVERDRGLRNPVLGLDHGSNVAGGPLTVSEEVKNAASDRVAKDPERVHDRHDIGNALY
jgi:hypothetical protein